MSRDKLLSLNITSEQDTIGLAQALAQLVSSSDCLLLQGDLGAGKSAFARALIKALPLGSTQALITEVPSPTYMLMLDYPYAQGLAVHADLYRLSNREEAEEIGLFDLFGTALLLIEWPERIRESWPAEALLMTIDIKENDHRSISFYGQQNWAQRLKDLKENKQQAG